MEISQSVPENIAFFIDALKLIQDSYSENFWKIAGALAGSIGIVLSSRDTQTYLRNHKRIRIVCMFASILIATMYFGAARNSFRYADAIITHLSHWKNADLTVDFAVELYKLPTINIFIDSIIIFMLLAFLLLILYSLKPTSSTQ